MRKFRRKTGFEENELRGGVPLSPREFPGGPSPEVSTLNRRASETLLQGGLGKK